MDLGVHYFQTQPNMNLPSKSKTVKRSSPGCSLAFKAARKSLNDQWPFQEPKLEVSTIYKAYVRAYMVQYLHFRILKFPLKWWLVAVINWALCWMNVLGMSWTKRSSIGASTFRRQALFWAHVCSSTNMFLCGSFCQDFVADSCLFFWWMFRHGHRPPEPLRVVGRLGASPWQHQKTNRGSCHGKSLNEMRV